MRKNLQKLILAGALVASTAHAAELRTPWISSRGPLRYTFDKLNECGPNYNWWSAAHFKEANRAFLKHSTDTQEISALIFNKSTFTLNEIFADSTVPLDSPNFNPFLAITSVSPRVSYTEYGITVGGSVDWPVWCNRGRIGLRASVPFRRIEVERDDDNLGINDNPLDEFVKTANLKVNRDNAGVVPGNANTAKDIMVTAYRMDLLNMLRNANNSPIMVAGVPTVTPLGISIFGTAIGAADDDPQHTPTAITISNGNTNIPFHHAFQFKDASPSDPTSSAFDAASIIPIAEGNTYLPLPTASTVTFFANNFDYTDVFTNPGFNNNKNRTWLIFRRQTNTNDPQKFGAGDPFDTGAGAGIADGINNLLAQANQNVAAFLTGQGFFLDDEIRSGMGDIDLDLFYEHTFCDDWRGELAVGVRFPTGGDKDQFGNPFKVFSLGNGEHFEIKLFGLMAWQVLCWMNIKIDASYNFVLENTEHRMAAFRGAQIKNFGPRADADVDWGYFIGHLDFNFIHPKTCKVRSMVGYEFYYKTKDHVSYKQATAVSFLGGNPAPLDNSLAERNTEAIAHKVRCETSVDVNKYFELFAGASATFAGQYVLKDRDLHAGWNIRF